jgi:hypothetical protein
MGSEVCPGCGAGIDTITPFAWWGDGVETRFACGSCKAKSGFTQSDRCRIAALSEELERVKADMQDLSATCSGHYQVLGGWVVRRIKALIPDSEPKEPT